MKKRHFKKSIFYLFILLFIVFLFGLFLLFIPKNNTSTTQTSVLLTPSPKIDEQQLELQTKYQPIFDKYHGMNTDYVAYLEWENDLLYPKDVDGIDPYPHVVVKSHILEDQEGDENDANLEYLRTSIAKEPLDFGQEFIDGANQLNQDNQITD